MKALLIAAVVAAAPVAAPMNPAQCQIVVRYMSDNPEKVELKMPNTLPCAYVDKADTALQAALDKVHGH